MEDNRFRCKHQPSFWHERWGSNHFEWLNTLNKEFRINLGTSFSFPARSMHIRLNYADRQLYGFRYPGSCRTAYKSYFSTSLHAKKELRAWKFHLSTDLLIQKSSNDEVLDLPLAAVKGSGLFRTSFQFRKTNGQLNFQLGIQVMYHTLYHPYSYMRWTGRLYRQDQVQTRRGAFLSVFLNLKLRRTRIFVMFDHVNSGLMGNDYFMIQTYPMNIRMFRYGLAWTFYD